MIRIYAVLLTLCLGAAGCSAQQLTRSNAQRILRESMAAGQFGGEIKAETHVQVGWFEQMWQENGANVEVTRLHTQAEIGFLDHLVEAGILQKMPDTLAWRGCNPQPGCKERNKWVNYSVTSSRDVEDVYKGMFVQDINQEFAKIVLARPANPTITGITQEGIDATVEFTYTYSPTPLFTHIAQLTRDDFPKCSIPELLPNPPFYCPRWGNWPSEADIAAKKESGSVELRKYDDGWRIVQQPR